VLSECLIISTAKKISEQKEESIDSVLDAECSNITECLIVWRDQRMHRAVKFGTYLCILNTCQTQLSSDSQSLNMHYHMTHLSFFFQKEVFKKMAALSSLSPLSDDGYPQPSLLPGEIVVARAVNVLRFQTMANRKSGISGVLYATNFRMSFLTRNPNAESQLNSVFQSNPDLSQAGEIYSDIQRELHIPQTCITDIFYYSSSTADGSKVKKVHPGSRMASKVHSLEIRCKDFRVVRFGLKFTPKKEHVKMVNTIAHYKAPSSIVLLFAFPYSMVQNENGKGRQDTIPTFRNLPDWLNELSRLQVDDTWRVATVNSKFQTCPSLSEMFVVLSSLSDSDINRMSLHYVDSRLPIWCWSHPKTGIPMLCSGAGR